MGVLRLVAGTLWFWSVGLLPTRTHDPLEYTVLAPAPPLWGWIVLPLPVWGLLAASAALLAALPGSRRGLAWLAVTGAVPIADLLRAVGWAFPATVAEPLVVVAATSMAAFHTGPRAHAATARLFRFATWWRIVPWGLAVFAAAWWYYEACTYYDRFLLGHIDFGQYAVRVASTWEGWGFLRETPGFPAFWDHFNPGLALLAPLWAAWPDPRMFLLLQAVLLALPIPLAAALARRLGASPAASAGWALVYLCFPPTSQLNVAYTYGWHPVTAALPLGMGSLLALAGRHYWSAAALGLLACAFKETVPIVAACLAAGLGWQRFAVDRRWQAPPSSERADHAEQGVRGGIEGVLSARVWWLVAGALIIAVWVLARVAPFSRFQAGKFAHLGATPLEMLTSLWLRPEVWGHLLAPSRTLPFILLLLLPWGLPSLAGGWTLRAPLVVPVGALIATGLAASTSIAFQYTTTLIPVLWLAAFAAGSGWEWRGGDETSSPAYTGSVVAASVSASLFFGSLPWSGPTRSLVETRSYVAAPSKVGLGTATIPALSVSASLGPGRLPGRSSTRRLLAQIDAIRSERHAARVLATGRIAAHLVGVRRLEAVSLALNRRRWASLQAEAGRGRSAIEVFTWILLDRRDVHQQSPEETARIETLARRAGYRVLWEEDGILCLRPPSPNAGRNLHEAP